MRKRRKILLIVFALIVFSWVIIAIIPPKNNFSGKNNLKITEGARPLLIAHGGGNKEFPDNTLEAFYHAYSVDNSFMMETDVSITKDGYIILSHDIDLDRKTNVSGLIQDHNYFDLLNNEVNFAYENSNGELVPYTNYLGKTVVPTDVIYPEGISPRHQEKFLVTSLEQLIKAFPNNYINVEIKQSGEVGLKALNAVIKLLDELDNEYNTYQRIVLASFHSEIYNELIKRHKINPSLMYSPATSGVIKFYLLQIFGLDLFFTDSIAVFQLPVKQAGITLSRASLIKKAHRHNIAVHYWTIDDEETMINLIKNGADGIMTNIPTLLKEVYNQQFN